MTNQSNSPQPSQQVPTNAFVTALVSVVIMFGMALIVQYGLNFFLRDVTGNRVHITYGGTFGLLVSLYVIIKMFAVILTGEIVTKLGALFNISVLPTSNTKLPHEKESDH